MLLIAAAPAANAGSTAGEHAGAVSERRCHSQDRAMDVRKFSYCPPESWFDEIAALPVFKDSFTLFNVGANKGFKLCSVAHRFSNQSCSSDGWFKELWRRAGHGYDISMCGACCACREVVSRLSERPVAIHAFELIGANVQWLRHAVRAFSLPNTVVVHAAASNATRGDYIRTTVNNIVGTENAPALFPGEAIPKNLDRVGGKTESVGAVALDDYIRDNGIRQIDMLSIDTEGFDGLVIEGARAAFAKGLVRVVEFEFSNMWFRHGRSLRRTIDLLHASQCECWWQGNNGCLAPLSAPCWSDAFDGTVPDPGFSNVVCACERHVIATMRRLSHGCQLAPRPPALTAAWHTQCRVGAQRPTKTAGRG